MNRTSQKVIQKNRWLFTREQLANTPSNRDGIERSEERLNRQNATCLIHDCGKKLNLPQQTINIGIVLLHRFFMLQSGFDSTLQIAKTFFGHESECFYVNNVGLWYGVNFFGWICQFTAFLTTKYSFFDWHFFSNKWFGSRFDSSQHKKASLEKGIFGSETHGTGCPRQNVSTSYRQLLLF